MPCSAFQGQLPFPKLLFKQACVTLISILMAWEADCRYATMGQKFMGTLVSSAQTDVLETQSVKVGILSPECVVSYLWLDGYGL